MYIKSLFQNIVVLSILFSFNITHSSFSEREKQIAREKKLLEGQSIFQKPQYLEESKIPESSLTKPVITEKRTEKTGQALSLLFNQYRLNINQYFNARHENDCSVFYVKRLIEEIDKNNFFIDPLSLNSPYCNFLKYIEARQCMGLLEDFHFFFDEKFLEDVYKNNENKKLQNFLDNLFTLFFLFPQDKTCENIICKHKTCKTRNDLNIYKAYGAIRVYVSLYLKRFNKETRELFQLKKRTEDIMRRLVPFVQGVLNADEKNNLRSYINQMIDSLFRQFSSTKVNYTRQDIEELKTKLISEIFTPIPQRERDIQMEINKMREQLDKFDQISRNMEPSKKEELRLEINDRISQFESRLNDLREKRINPKPTRYQQYIKTLKGFFRRDSEQSQE